MRALTHFRAGGNVSEPIDQPKRRGRPRKAPGDGLSGRIPDRLPQDVADKYRQLGRDWLIDAVRQAKVPG